MSHIALNVLVGTAQISRRFRERLLNGDRPAVLAEFDLTDEERDFLLGIEADSVQEFAAQLDEWLQAQGNPRHLCNSGDIPQQYDYEPLVAGLRWPRQSRATDLVRPGLLEPMIR